MNKKFPVLMTSHLDARGCGLILKNHGRKYPETPEEIYNLFDMVHKDMKSMGINTVTCNLSDEIWIRQCLKSAENNGLMVMTESFAGEIREGCSSPEVMERKIHSSPPHMRIPRAYCLPDIESGWGKSARTVVSVKDAVAPIIDETVMEEAEEKTEAFLMYDSANLYVKFICHEPEMDKLKTSGWKYWQVHPILNEDVVRIIINPFCGDKAKHMCIDSTGRGIMSWCVLDVQNKVLKKAFYDRDWEENWENLAAVQSRINPASWEIFLKMPLSSLGITSDTGIKHRMNIIREEQGKGEVTCWSAFFSFYNPEKFGTFEFIEEDFIAGGSPLTGKVVANDGEGLKGTSLTCGGTTIISKNNGYYALPCTDSFFSEISAYKLGYTEKKIKKENCEKICLDMDPLYKGDGEKIKTSVKNKIDIVKNSKAVVSHYLYDEPPVYFGPAVGKIKELVSVYDPGKETVVGIAVLNYIKSLVETAGLEKISVTLYPFYDGVAEGDFEASIEYTGMGYTEYMDFIHSIVPGVTIYMPIQAFCNKFRISQDINALWTPSEKKPGWRMPSPEEVKCTVFLSLAHGVKGIWYFTYNYFSYDFETVWGLVDENGNKNRELAEVIREINLLIEKHSETLVGLCRVKNIAEIKEGYADIQTHLDKDGKVYLFAVNKNVRETVNLAIKAKQRASSAYEVFSDRIIEVKTGSDYIEFEDCFEKAEGRLYKLVL